MSSPRWSLSSGRNGGDVSSVLARMNFRASGGDLFWRAGMIETLSEIPAGAFLSRSDLDGSADIDARPDFLNFGVGHGDAAVSPVARKLPASEPAEPVGQAVDHDVATGRNAALARLLAVAGVRIGDAHRQVEPAAVVLEVDQVAAFRRAAVAFLLLVADRIAA